VVADAGYWHQEQMQRAMADGVRVLVTPDGGLRKGPRRPGWDGGLHAFMRVVLSTECGAALYKLRAQLIGPIFGNTKHNRQDRAVLPTRQSGLLDRLASDHRRPQPDEAPQALPATAAT
jgi:hypothetical protein